MAEMVATKRFCRYLALRYPKIISLLDLTRDIMESYLIYLQTEAKERKNYRSDLYGLRRVIEDVGNHYDRQDIKNLFISTDFPSTPRYLFKFYSDETIKKLNENIFQMDEQIARALILHQLLGTRISDTLTLKTDCLSIRENRYFIRIEQVKSITFEKAISDEIAQLIIKSIDYTEEHYGKTKYIFVKKEDPCLMLLSIVTITQNYMDRQLKLHKTAREMAVLAAGVQGSQSDMIRLRRVYAASLTPKCPGIQTILLENHCIVHKFNGYDAINGDVTGESAIYVFLTEHGSVYHRKRSCKHLNIDILPVSGRDVGAKRNKDGKIYDTCKKCLKLTKEELKRTTVFITDYGVKYHTEINCPDLKRSLHVVLLSQAEGRAACKDCCRE